NHYLALIDSTSARSYVQPRSRKISNRIGIGIPKSQSKIYPVAPASLIFALKRIQDVPSLFNKLKTPLPPAAADDHGTLLPLQPKTKKITHMTRNRKNRNLAIPA